MANGAVIDHLRFAGLEYDRQAALLTSILRADPLVWSILERARDLDLPDWMLVSGAIYNTAAYITGQNIRIDGGITRHV